MVSDKTPEVLQKKRDVSEKNIRQWFDSVKEYAVELEKIRRKNLKPEMRFRHALSAPEWRKYLEEQENEKRQIEEEKKRKFRERVEQRKKKKEDEDEEIKKRERLLKEQQKIAADKKKKRRKHC